MLQLNLKIPTVNMMLIQLDFANDTDDDNNDTDDDDDETYAV